MALGTVAHGWNRLLVRLGELFRVVTRLDHNVAAAIWYAIDNDAAQISMLKAAAKAAPPKQWPRRLTKAADDIEWLADRALSLRDLRNDAIHAPCVFSVGAGTAEVTPDFWVPHNRAKKFYGKRVVEELVWFENWAAALAIFAVNATRALTSESQPWPEKPEKPDRRPKKSHPQSQ